MQGNDESLATRAIGAYTVQGNDKPLATMGDWAMTFNNCEVGKALAINLIEPIAILHHQKSAIAPAMKLVYLQLPSQQMRWSKTFVSSLQKATSTWLHCTTNNVVHCRSNNNSSCVRTSGTWRLRWWSPPLLRGVQVPGHWWQQSAKLTISSLATIRLFHCHWTLRVSTTNHKWIKLKFNLFYLVNVLLIDNIS